MKPSLLYTFSLILIGFLTYGQGADSLAADGVTVNVSDSLLINEEVEEISEKDSLFYPFLSSVAVLYDYGKLIGMVMETESKQEVGLQLDFKNKFVIVGEYGLATLEPNGAYQNAQYISSGYYYRVGLGYKISLKTKNNFVLTFRYAESYYSDEGNIIIQSPSGIYDDFTEPFDREETTAQWYEVVLSSETRMWKSLYMGFHLRLRVMGNYETREPLDVFSIPGYGKTIDKTIPAFNLYVKYAFEFF